MRKLKIEESDFTNEIDNNHINNFDQNAPRKYKQLSLNLNQYEFDLLTKACEKDGRSQKSFIRLAMINSAKKVLGHST